MVRAPTPVRAARSEGPERCSVQAARTSAAFSGVGGVRARLRSGGAALQTGQALILVAVHPAVGRGPGNAHFLRHVGDRPDVTRWIRIILPAGARRALRWDMKTS